MFRPEFVRRPVAFFGEFHSQEVSDSLVHAIANDAAKRAVAVVNDHFGALLVRMFALKANAGERNVLQDHDFTLSAAGLVTPADVNKICTKQAFYGPSVCHAGLIGTIRLFA